MEKKELQQYALWAKENLERQVEVSLKALGILSDNEIKSAKVVGDYTVIDGDATSYPKDLFGKRETIICYIKDDGYNAVIEELAYTWFNRFVALRFMEVHDFMPHGFRVLSSRDGSVEPEIIKNLIHIKDELNLDLSLCEKLKQQGIEELYRYVLFRQCKALSDILPMLFEAENDCLELLLPKTLLLGDSVLTKLIALGEDVFYNDVEIIGWLYQFYISAKKVEVYKEKKTITKDTLPAVTQLFTPDWIVRYMTENSLGRLWLESYPASPLKNEMQYYVPNSEQPEEVQRQIDAIKYSSVNPEDIRIIEPCCGSGHILVYLFDLLCKIYEEKGYQRRDIPTLILSKNLYGLDIDKRASQLASFALVMKARNFNPRFFTQSYYVKPQVYEILDSRSLYRISYKKLLEETKLFSHDEIGDIEYLAETFHFAKTIGSLIKVKPMNLERINNTIKVLEQKVVYNVFNIDLLNNGVPIIKKLAMQAKVLSDKYDIMITNPPYIGISSMESHVKDYALAFYPNSKTDMFAMFMETEFLKPNGFLAMINMHSWMFLSSYENFRKEILRTREIITMAHLGAHAFESIGGEVVQTTSFISRNCNIGGNGVYFRLVDSNDKENDFLKALKSSGGGELYVVKADIFSSLPNSLIIYWLSNAIINVFEKGITLSSIAAPKQGLATGKNELFVRMWHEISFDKLHLNATDSIQAMYTGKKWFPYNKGGAFRKWYGNNDYVINWETNGRVVSNFSGSVIRNSNFYFFESVSWSKIASGPIAFRYKPQGHIFDVAGCSVFSNHAQLVYLLGVVNSNVVMNIIKATAPTINYEVGQISNIPIIFGCEDEVRGIVENNVKKSKTDWDSFEESWDFKKHPLL